LLVNFPESGRIVPEKNNPEIRELIEGNYRIFYKAKKNEFQINAIIHIVFVLLNKEMGIS